MPQEQAERSILHWSQRETERLAWAFVLSVALHLIIWGGWYSGRKFGIWDRIQLPHWVQRAKLVPAFLKEPPPRQLTQEEPPLMFINVNEAQATTEPPKDAAFYSSRNSVAANPKADIDSNVPKIEGSQTDIPRAVTTPRPEVVRLQPTAKPAPIPEMAKPTVEPQEEIKAAPETIKGDLALAKPQEPTLKPDTGTQPRPRPRTIKEAMARQFEAPPPGEAMRQEGGVKRHLEIASFDAKATLSGAYDAAMVEAISQRWFTLLDQRAFASDGRGKVILQFVLHPDGRISDMKVAENSAGEVLGLICQAAVLEPAPFAPWPAEMRRALGEERKIQFSFFYH